MAENPTHRNVIDDALAGIERDFGSELDSYPARQNVIDGKLSTPKRQPQSKIAENPTHQNVITAEFSTPERRPQSKITENPTHQNVTNDEFPTVRRRSKTDLAVQMASYLFETDENWPYYYSQNHSVSNKVEKTGALFGFYAAYTFSLYEPLRSGKDILNHISPNFLKFEIEGSKGKIDYSSYATGKLDGFSAQELEARILWGYDFLLSRSTIITPYMGIGYRIFSDNTGGWVDYFVKDYAKYTIQTKFPYLPVGFETLTKLNEQWDLNYQLEGDFVIGGEVNYNLQEIPGTFPGVDVDTGAPLTLIPQNATSKLKGGFGFRTSMKLIRKFKNFDIFAEPYLKFWT